MTIARRPWLVPYALLTLCLYAGDASAQQDQSVDPWQFPKFTDSKPFERWWWAFSQRAYPLGEIPEGAKLRALQEIEQYKAIRAPSPEAIQQEERWQNIGPAPILGGQIGAEGHLRPMSGRVTAIAVDPGDTNHWLIGAAQGGIWETRDGGTTWAAKTDNQASLAMGAIAFAPSDPNIIYAGTGEANFSGDSYAGAGLLKSTDGGNTWTLLATSTFAKATFSAIRVHPSNPNIVLATTTFGIAGFDGSFPPSVPPRGIFKSTDGGATWSRKLSGEATSLEVDPSNFSNQYAGIGNIFGSSLNGVYRSTDAGETWTLITGPWSTMAGGVGRVELALSTSAAFVSIQDAFNSVGHDGGLLGLFRTEKPWDPTPTWTQIPTESTDDGTGVLGYCGWDAAFRFAGDSCDYSHKIIVDPSSVGATTLYAGGIPLWKCTTCFIGAATWTEVSKTALVPRNGIHVDQHAMAWAGSRLIVGNDGGVWSSPDGWMSWFEHNTNLAITQFYGGSLHPTDPNFALGGSQDNGTEKRTGTDAWDWIFFGDGSANAISSSHPDTQWAVSSQRLNIQRTTDGGITFTDAAKGILNRNSKTTLFVAPFEKCPANDNIFIAGTTSLWQATNFFSSAPGSPAWSAQTVTPSTTGKISALAFAASDPTCSTYAYGTSSGELRLTSNFGTTWVDIDVSNAVPNRYVTGLSFDPINPNVLYVTLTGFDEGTTGQPGHVFKTANALAPVPTWSNVSPPVNIPHNTIAVDPANSNIVFVGTDLGVWKSADAGAAWTHMGPETGMPNVAVFDMKIHHATGKAVAFTHGRGAFSLVQAVPATAAVALNGSAFRTGQTISYQATLTPGSTPVQVDIFLGALLPDGVTILSLVQGAAGVISIALGASPIPFRTNVTLTPTVVTFSYTFQGFEPVGRYSATAGLAVAGSNPPNTFSAASQIFSFMP